MDFKTQKFMTKKKFVVAKKENFDEINKIIYENIGNENILRIMTYNINRNPNNKVVIERIQPQILIIQEDILNENIFANFESNTRNEVENSINIYVKEPYKIIHYEKMNIGIEKRDIIFAKIQKDTRIHLIVGLHLPIPHQKFAEKRKEILIKMNEKIKSMSEGEVNGGILICGDFNQQYYIDYKGINELKLGNTFYNPAPFTSLHNFSRLDYILVPQKNKFNRRIVGNYIYYKRNLKKYSDHLPVIIDIYTGNIKNISTNLIEIYQEIANIINNSSTNKEKLCEIVVQNKNNIKNFLNILATENPQLHSKIITLMNENDQNLYPYKIIITPEFLSLLISNKLSGPMWNPANLLPYNVFKIYETRHKEPIDGYSNFDQTILEEILQNVNFKRNESAVSFIINFFKNKNNKILLVKSGTGSGKTTILPGLFLESGLNNGKKIVCTQPRQINAENNSEFVAKLISSKIEKIVGYKHGNSPKDSQTFNTKVLYATEGTILNEMLKDIEKFCDKYSYVLLDEIHERNIETDLLIALFKNLSKKIEKLPNLIIMSATFNPQEFLNYFNLNEECAIYILGKKNEIEVKSYFIDSDCEFFETKQTNLNNYIEEIINLCLKIHVKFPNEIDINIDKAKDILVFVDGVETIKLIKEKFSEVLHDDKIRGRIYDPFSIFELTSQTSKEDKDLKILIGNYGDLEIFNTHNSGNLHKKRRIILSTNTAETGITFKYLKYVIDSGWMKQKLFNSNNKSDSLLRTHISQDNYVQRMGRIGRIEPGIFFGLYSEESLQHMRKFKRPAIILQNIENNLIDLMHFINKNYDLIEINDIYQIDFLQSPPINNILSLYTKLLNNGLISKNLVFTNFGEKCIQLHQKTRLGIDKCFMILKSVWFGCSYEISLLLVLLENYNHIINTTFSIKKTQKIYLSILQNEFNSDHINLLLIGLNYIRQIIFYDNISNENNKHFIDNWCSLLFLDPRKMRFIYNRFLDILSALSQLKIPIISLNLHNELKSQIKFNQNQADKIIQILCCNDDNIAHFDQNSQSYILNNGQKLLVFPLSSIQINNKEHSNHKLSKIIFSNFELKIINNKYENVVSIISSINPNF